MHNTALAEMGLNWRYLALAVRSDELSSALAGAKAMGFIGLNLTVPHKLLAMPLVDALDESSALWGAVNTIRFEGRDSGGEWLPLRCFSESPFQIRTHGFNTDADAIVTALNEDLDFHPLGARVLLLGAGGAGRTAALKLASENPKELFLVNRTESKAQAIAIEIAKRCPAVKLTVGYPQGDVDLVLNATSLGLRAEDALPMDQKLFSFTQAKVAYDMIYRPAQTAFLQAAKNAGCRVSNGLGMLLHQGARALEIWTGQPPPIQTMRAALEATVQ